MTYKEYYRNVKSMKELTDIMIKDIAHAKLFNTDRIPVIKKAYKEVCMERFGFSTED